MLCDKLPPATPDVRGHSSARPPSPSPPSCADPHVGPRFPLPRAPAAAPPRCPGAPAAPRHRLRGPRARLRGARSCACAGAPRCPPPARAVAAAGGCEGPWHVVGGAWRAPDRPPHRCRPAAGSAPAPPAPAPLDAHGPRNACRMAPAAAVARALPCGRRCWRLRLWRPPGSPGGGLPGLQHPSVGCSLRLCWQ